MFARANRIPSLDGLRAASILLVVFSHELGTRGFLAVDTVGPFINLGNLGVRVFFVISGFLITTLLLEEKREFGSITWDASTCAERSAFSRRSMCSSWR